jgi:hypothetical protein
MLDALDLRHDTVLVAAEVDNTVVLLVPTALMTRRNVTVTVTASTPGLLFHQRRQRDTLVESLVDHTHHGTLSW